MKAYPMVNYSFMKPYRGHKSGSMTLVRQKETWWHLAKWRIIIQVPRSKKRIYLKKLGYSLLRREILVTTEVEVRLPIVYAASSRCTHLTPKWQNKWKLLFKVMQSVQKYCANKVINSNWKIYGNPFSCY